MNKQPSQFSHAEAFCLMQYASDDGCEIEFIWNSRNGVTPFSITSRRGTELRHVNWQADRKLPHFRPQPGSRIFVDMTPERARESAQKTVERWWNEPNGHWRQLAEEMGMTREYLVDLKAIEYLGDGHSPCLEVVPDMPDVPEMGVAQ
jgi:hypothetical protein